MSDKALRCIADEDLDHVYAHDDGQECVFSRPTGEYFLHGQGLGDDALCDRSHGKPGESDPVALPPHYRHLPVECIEVAEHFGYCLGNVIKYVWRHQH